MEAVSNTFEVGVIADDERYFAIEESVFAPDEQIIQTMAGFADHDRHPADVIWIIDVECKVEPLAEFSKFLFEGPAGDGHAAEVDFYTHEVAVFGGIGILPAMEDVEISLIEKHGGFGQQSFAVGGRNKENSVLIHGMISWKWLL